MCYNILGKEVIVKVDRPLNSYHPKYKDLKYPVNYGYIEGIIGGDGEFQDAYILGVKIPLKEFYGVVIGIVERKNDNETKWVVASKKDKFEKNEILDMISFQEKYFDSKLITIYELDRG